jgi:hypothetical protein
MKTEVDDAEDDQSDFVRVRFYDFIAGKAFDIDVAA